MSDIRTLCKEIRFIPILLFSVFAAAPVQARTSAETAFLKTLVTPSLGTTPDDWIAFMGEPIKKHTPAPDGINDKALDLVFDRGDVQIWARSFNGIVSRILFVAMDQKTSKTGFTWDESNIWTVLQQYGIRPFELKDDQFYPGTKDGVHGDFEVNFNPPNVPRNRNTVYEFSSLELVSSSMEKSEMAAREKLASGRIPEGLNAQFDVVFNSVFKENNWWVEGAVKNNSSVAVTRASLKPLIYVFDDKRRLLAVYPGAFFPFIWNFETRRRAHLSHDIQR